MGVRTTGSHALSGYLAPSKTGMSIRYDLEIEGRVYAIGVGEKGPHGEPLGTSGGPLHGESLRWGYLSVSDAPDGVSALFERPRFFDLTVSFKSGRRLTAEFRRSTRRPTDSPPVLASRPDRH